ncbi:hypothetical protein [Desulfosudis oleivorans]|nr:hypothetical protein [Desulfosudis oleivorans]
MINTRQIIVGITFLFIGALVYLFDRPADMTYLVYTNPFNLSFYGLFPPVFGFLGNTLPAFLHVAAFILLTVGVSGWGRKTYLPVCLFWLIVDAGFELGQKYSTNIAKAIPGWFDDIYLLENTKNYFVFGTYSSLDLVAILLGGIAAYGILIYTEIKRGEK